MIAYFLTFTIPETRLTDAELDRLAGFLRRTPGLAKALVFTPEAAHDPYLDDGPCPALMLECHFPNIEALEAVIAEGGYFRALASAELIPGLAGATVTQQAMLSRGFPVPDPVYRTPAGRLPCTYVVAYEGSADDLNLWLSHYIAHHPPIMARFPGIRAIEICTRIDWCSGLPWTRVDYMQRNSVAFDDAASLNAALNSPVRDEMRADFKNFPPFCGRNSHYPMAAITVLPAPSPSRWE
jgi:uncharacterized protein (TIGR02118 family)